MVASNVPPRRPGRVGLAALAALTATGVAACSAASEAVDAGDDPPADDSAAPRRLPAEPVATSAPTTSPVATTVAPTETSTTRARSTTTTSRPATSTTTLFVEAPVPQPIAPPTDEYADEPVIEIGSIAIPKLSVDMTMYEGIRLTTLDRGPGHWPGSAMPGQVGNVVVGGHRVSSHQVFRNVDQLVPGDEIFFRDDDVEHRYVVRSVEIVEPTAMWIVDPTETATATLFACHPPGSTAQRIVVFADLADSTRP